MNTVTMNSGTLTEFLLFPDLPFELRQMVWDEALPHLDLQRFNAEIAPQPHSAAINELESPANFVLCLTPNDDFVQLTSDYRGLLGTFQESRKAAIAKISYLPINYIVRGSHVSFAVRAAKVPFNPDGRLCVSGLGLALCTAAQAAAARSVVFSPTFDPRDIQCLAFPETKNLTISFEWPQDLDRMNHEGLLAFTWCDRMIQNMLQKMNKLETVALMDEVVLNQRHHVDPKDFEWLHKSAPVVRPGEDGHDWDYNLDAPYTIKVPRLELFRHFTSSINTGKFDAVKGYGADRIFIITF